MKKRNQPGRSIGIVIVLAIILCLWGTVAFADTAFKNSAADCFGFFASKITFEDDRIIVEGYFYNFTLDYMIHGIDNLEMEIYDADEKTICYGAFNHLSDSLQNIRLQPGFSSLQVFEFNGTVRNPGDYNLENFSAGILCHFTPSSY